MEELLFDEISRSLRKTFVIIMEADVLIMVAIWGSNMEYAALGYYRSSFLFVCP